MNRWAVFTTTAIGLVICSGIAFAAGTGHQVSELDEGENHIKLETYKRSRILLLRNSNFQEFEIDPDGSGVAALREFTFNDGSRVRYSSPTRLGYHQIFVELRERDGFVSSDFFLSKDGTRYVLSRSLFQPYRHLHDTCATGGSDLNVLDPKIKQLIETSAIIDDSCRASDKDFLAIETAISTIRDSSSSTSGPGQYIACLRDHNQKYYATVEEQNFYNMLHTKRGSDQAPIVCDNDSSYAGDYDEETGLIHLKPSQNLDYTALLFHESLHKAGIADEGLVVAIVDCCSQKPALNGASSDACMKMNHLFMGKQRMTANAEALERGLLPGYAPLMDRIQKGAALAPGETRADIPADLDRAATMASYELGVIKRLQGSGDKSPIVDKAGALSYCQDKLGILSYACESAASVYFNKYESCMTLSSSGEKPSQDDCIDQAVMTEALDLSLSNCKVGKGILAPDLAAKLSSQCNAVANEVNEIFSTNAVKDCSGMDSSDYDKSCLSTVIADADSIYHKILEFGPSASDKTGLGQTSEADLQCKTAYRPATAYLTAMKNDFGSDNAVMNTWYSKVRESSDTTQLGRSFNVFIGLLDQDVSINHLTTAANLHKWIQSKGGFSGYKAFLDGLIASDFLEACSSDLILEKGGRGQSDMESARSVCRNSMQVIQGLIDQNIQLQTGCQDHTNPGLIGEGLNFNCLAKTYADGNANLLALNAGKPIANPVDPCKDGDSHPNAVAATEAANRLAGTTTRSDLAFANTTGTVSSVVNRSSALNMASVNSYYNLANSAMGVAASSLGSNAYAAPTAVAAVRGMSAPPVNTGSTASGTVFSGTNPDPFAGAGSMSTGRIGGLGEHSVSTTAVDSNSATASTAQVSNGAPTSAQQTSVGEATGTVSGTASAGGIYGGSRGMAALSSSSVLQGTSSADSSLNRDLRKYFIDNHGSMARALLSDRADRGAKDTFIAWMTQHRVQARLKEADGSADGSPNGSNDPKYLFVWNGTDFILTLREGR